MTMAKDLEVYQETIGRMEPDIAPVDASAYYASAAISLKRIADALELIAGVINTSPVHRDRG